MRKQHLRSGRTRFSVIAGCALGRRMTHGPRKPLKDVVRAACCGAAASGVQVPWERRGGGIGRTVLRAPAWGATPSGVLA